jgi:hypothetical protein
MTEQHSAVKLNTDSVGSRTRFCRPPEWCSARSGIAYKDEQKRLLDNYPAMQLHNQAKKWVPARKTVQMKEIFITVRVAVGRQITRSGEDRFAHGPRTSGTGGGGLDRLALARRLGRSGTGNKMFDDQPVHESLVACHRLHRLSHRLRRELSTVCRTSRSTLLSPDRHQSDAGSNPPLEENEE